jgi:hypothetical protein
MPVLIGKIFLQILDWFELNWFYFAKSAFGKTEKRKGKDKKIEKAAR